MNGNRSRRRDILVGLGALFVLLATGGVLWQDLWGTVEPSPQAKPLNNAFSDPTPVRTVPDVMKVGRKTCGYCHEDLDPPKKDPVHFEKRHKKAVLNHGTNERCFNCHHPDPEKRDFFVADDGSPIALPRVNELCAKCHGVAYRDWKVGAHGRRTGFWDSAMGEQRALKCIACHDPHSPRFKSLFAAPGPHSGRTFK